MISCSFGDDPLDLRRWGPRSGNCHVRSRSAAARCARTDDDEPHQFGCRLPASENSRMCAPRPDVPSRSATSPSVQTIGTHVRGLRGHALEPGVQYRVARVHLVDDLLRLRLGYSQIAGERCRRPGRRFGPAPWPCRPAAAALSDRERRALPPQTGDRDRRSNSLPSTRDRPTGQQQCQPLPRR